MKKAMCAILALLMALSVSFTVLADDTTLCAAGGFIVSVPAAWKKTTEEGVSLFYSREIGSDDGGALLFTAQSLAPIEDDENALRAFYAELEQNLLSSIEISNSQTEEFVTEDGRLASIVYGMIEKNGTREFLSFFFYIRNNLSCMCSYANTEGFYEINKKTALEIFSSIHYYPDIATEPDNYRALKVGDESDEVLQARNRLWELGYFNKKPTQKEYTKGMTEYVEAFQTMNGLEPTGELSEYDLYILYSPIAISKDDKMPFLRRSEEAQQTEAVADIDVVVPVGQYVVGEDIPAGAYTIKPQGVGVAISVHYSKGGRSKGVFTAFEGESIGKLELEDGNYLEIAGGAALFSTYTGLGFK